MRLNSKWIVGFFNSPAVHTIEFHKGELYAGGYFDDSFFATRSIAKWDGANWAFVSGGVDGAVYALASYHGYLYVAGRFDSAGGWHAENIARWDGANFMALGSGTDDAVSSLAVFNSELYLGGSFTSAGGIAAPLVAKWNGLSWSGVGTGLLNSTQLGAVRSMVVVGGELYVALPGPSFSNLNSDLVKWDGAAWSRINSGTNGGISDIAIAGNTLFAAGVLEKAGGKPSGSFAVWQPRVNVTETTVSAEPGAMVIGNDPFGFYRPALTLSYGTGISYSGGLPTTVTLDRAPEIRMGGKRINGAFVLGPENLQFSGDATLRVEFSEDDVTLFGGSYKDFRAVQLTYGGEYPASKEALSKVELPGQSAPVPIRIDNGRQIYAITAPISQIGSVYAAVPPSATRASNWGSYE